MKSLVTVLVAALLTGCSAAPTSPVSARTGSAAPMAAPVKAPVAKSASSATTLSTAACPGPVSVISGVVRDQDGHPVADGVGVHVTSSDEAAPYTLDVQVMGGVYVLSQVPMGVPLLVKVTGKTGFVRTRSLTLVGEGCSESDAIRAELNFGGPATVADPTGNLFYLPSK